MRRRPSSPVVNVRSAERRFLDEFLVMLADGFKMRKHGRRGGPKDRLVRLDGDMIVWTAVRPSFRLSERGGVAVAARALSAVLPISAQSKLSGALPARTRAL